MNVREYQIAAREFAVYGEHAFIYYPAFGLIGEIGELNEKRNLMATPIGFQQLFNEKGQCVGMEKSPVVTRTDLIDEAGDCLWYLAALCTDLGMSLEYLIGTGIGGFFHDVVPVHPVDVTVATGKIAEAAKKHIRDGKMNVGRMTEGMKSLFVFLLWMAQIHEFTLDEAAERNIEKLFSRKQRGVLKGDGDKR